MVKKEFQSLSEKIEKSIKNWSDRKLSMGDVLSSNTLNKLEEDINKDIKEFIKIIGEDFEDMIKHNDLNKVWKMKAVLKKRAGPKLITK